MAVGVKEDAVLSQAISVGCCVTSVLHEGMNCSSGPGDPLDGFLILTVLWEELGASRLYKWVLPSEHLEFNHL